MDYYPDKVREYAQLIGNYNAVKADMKVSLDYYLTQVYDKLSGDTALTQYDLDYGRIGREERGWTPYSKYFWVKIKKVERAFWVQIFVSRDEAIFRQLIGSALEGVDSPQMIQTLKGRFKGFELDVSIGTEKVKSNPYPFSIIFDFDPENWESNREKALAVFKNFVPLIYEHIKDKQT